MSRDLVAPLLTLALYTSHSLSTYLMVSEAFTFHLVLSFITLILSS